MILVVFDIDGTLTDTSKVDNFCFGETFKKLHQVDWDNFNWDGIPHISDSGLTNSYFLDEHGREPTLAEIETLQHTFMQMMKIEFDKDADQFSEITGAGSLFKALKNHSSIDLALATGCWKCSALFKLNAANIPFSNEPLAHADHHYDRAIITKEAVQQAQSKYGNAYEHIVYVGDGIWDAQTTQKLQIPFIGIDYHRDDKLKKHGTEVIINEYSNVENFEDMISEAIITFEKKTKNGSI